jgi:ribosomal protein L24
MEKEGSLEASNLALWCGKCGAGRRSRADVKEGQKKRRVCAKCGSAIESA